MSIDAVPQTNLISLDPVEVSVPLGSRVAFLFDTPEQRFRFVPFIAAGLIGGDKCLILTDGEGAAGFRSALAAIGIEAAAYEADGSLVIITDAISVESIEGITQSILEDAQGRFRFGRCINDTSWMTLLGWTARDFLRVEVKGHLLTQQQPLTIICQYDTRAIDRDELGQITTAHQYTVKSQGIERNPDRRQLTQIIFDGMDEQLRALTRLQDLSLRLTATLGLDETLDAIIEAAMNICRANRASISCFNEFGDLKIIRHRGLSQEYLGRRRLTREDPIVAGLIASKRPMIVDVKDLAGRSPNYEAWASENVRSIVTMPLISEGEVFGLIGAASSTARTYSQTDADTMAILAAQSSAAITTARLVERLREANRAKDEFLATLSHELRTPLTPILGWINILRRFSTTDPVLMQGLDTIERNARQQAELINDLLDMTRIINGKIELVREMTDMTALVQSSTNHIRPQADARGIRLDLRVPSQPILCNVDPLRIQQVMANLLNNAVKFTPDGGSVTIALNVYRQLTVEGLNKGQWIAIEVADSGIGIDPDFINQVFERFTQAHGGLNRRFGGLGLGLAIAKALVEMHGGEITASSEGLGKGSQFTVCLPLTLAVPEHLAGAATYPVTRDDVAPTLHFTGPPPSAIEFDVTPHGDNDLFGIKVLLVEDSQDTLDMLALWLRSYGCEVQTAARVSDGLALASSHNPDLIISDIGMPDVSGYDLIRLVRQSPGLAQVPAIALTGYARDEDRERAIAAGYNAHVAKPAEMRRLIDLIKELTSRHTY